MVSAKDGVGVIEMARIAARLAYFFRRVSAARPALVLAFLVVASLSFPVDAAAQSTIPTIHDVSPTRGSPAGGTIVILRGTNLAGVTDVRFGLTPAPAFEVFNGGAAIRATAPPGNGTVVISVTGPSGTSAPPPPVYDFGYESLLIVDNPLPEVKLGRAYRHRMTATGGTGPYTFVISRGALYPGLTLDLDGTISGTPTGSTTGFTVKVTDSNGAFGTRDFSGQMSTPTVTVTSTVPVARRGLVYSAVLTASGATAPYSFVLHSGSLPAGITLSSTGSLAGTPTVVGSFPFAVRVTDSSTGGGNFPYSFLGNLTLVVSAAEINATPTSLPSVIAGLPFEQSLSAIGGAGSYSFAVAAGSLPSGITLSSNGRLAGRSYEVGTYAFTVTTTDSFGNTGSLALALTVAARPDPSSDIEVRGLNTAQEEATRRLTSSQIDNISRRLEALRDGYANDLNLDIRMSASGSRSRPSMGLFQRLGLAAGEERTDPLRNEVAALRFGSIGLEVDGRGSGVSRRDSGLAPMLGGGTSGTLGASSTSSDRDAANPVRENGVRVWTGGAISFGRSGSTSDQDELTITSDGLSVGIDVAVNDRLDLGFALGFGTETTEIGSRNSSADTTSVFGAAYASFRPTGGVYFDAMLGQGSLSYDLIRRVSIDNSLVFGERDGRVQFGSLGMGFDRLEPSGRWTTYGRVQAFRADLDGYSETGSPFWALQYDDRTLDSVQAVVGLRYSGTRVHRDQTWRPMARVELHQELGAGGNQTLAYADFLTGPSYQIGSTAWNRSLLVAGLGLSVDMVGGWTAEGELGVQSRDNEGLGTLRVSLSRRF